MDPAPGTEKVVTRFAPSPTGFLHVGGARTALYNWLFARKHGGKFLLRIEDTDQERHVPEAEGAIFESLRWLGIQWDEGPSGSNPGGPGDGGPNGPYRQSERRAIYDKFFEKLLAEGKAYRCYATPADLDAARKQAERERRPFRYTREQFAHLAAGKTEKDPHVVRLVMPNQKIVIHDLISGDVTKEPETFSDLVIRKANGWPTFHFAVVADDYAMGVTHVIRAKEHLENTHNHIAIQEAMGFPTPIYAHIPIVLNANGSKMSKRNKGAKVEDYRNEGFLPEALVNYMALVGWSPGDDREIITRDEMVKLFSLEGISKSNGRWDLKKCTNFNAQYVRKTPLPELRAIAMDWLGRQVDRWLPAFQTRMETVSEFVQTAAPLWVPEYLYDEDAVAKNIGPDAVQNLGSTARLIANANWTAEALHSALEQSAADTKTTLGKVAQPVRIALTGRTVSPPVNETLTRLGRDESLRRLARTLAILGERYRSKDAVGDAMSITEFAGRHEDGLKYAELGIRIFGEETEFIGLKALALSYLGQAEEAERVAREAARHRESRSRELATIGRLMMEIADELPEKRRKKLTEEAIALAGKAAEGTDADLDTKSRAVVLKAYGLRRIGKEDPALKVLQPVLETSGRGAPTDGDAWESLLAELGPKLPGA